MTASTTAHFRRLGAEDLPMLAGWLRHPDVVRWWEGDDTSDEAIAATYGPDRGVDDTEHWLYVPDGVPVGWIQCDAADGTDEESATWGPHLDLRHTAGIDYIVDPSVEYGRGTGSTMIRRFVDEVVFELHADWQTVAAGPFRGNEPSWRALGRAGFHQVVDLPGDGRGGDGTDRDDGPARLMARSRA